MYTPAKKIKGIKWDAKATITSQRSFKYLVVALTGMLDQFSEISAIFFHPQLPKLSPGRASFQSLKNFAQNPFLSPSRVIMPKAPLIEELHEVLNREIAVEGPQKYWLDLLLLYRNKLAHLGTSMFWGMGIANKEDDFFIFLPNRWPYFIEQDITASHEKPKGTVRECFEEILICQDVVEYSEMVTGRIKRLLNGGIANFKILSQTLK